MNEIYFIDMLDGILLELPQCPTGIAENAMKKAAIDWFNETLTWSVDLPSITTVEDLALYQTILPKCSDLVLMDALIKDDGKVLSSPLWNIRLPGTIVFAVPPKPDIRFTPRAFITPSRGSIGVPCPFERYIDAWEHGALAYLRAQASRPWFSMPDAERHRALFRAEISGARNKQNVGRRSGNLRVTPRPLI